MVFESDLFWSTTMLLSLLALERSLVICRSWMARDRPADGPTAPRAEILDAFVEALHGIEDPATSRIVALSQMPRPAPSGPVRDIPGHLRRASRVATPIELEVGEQLVEGIMGGVSERSFFFLPKSGGRRATPRTGAAVQARYRFRGAGCELLSAIVETGPGPWRLELPSMIRRVDERGRPRQAFSWADEVRFVLERGEDVFELEVTDVSVDGFALLCDDDALRLRAGQRVSGALLIAGREYTEIQAWVRHVAPDLKDARTTRAGCRLTAGTVGGRAAMRELVARCRAAGFGAGGAGRE